MKRFIYRFSPGVLHTFYERIEASPLGYRLAKGAFWSLAGSLISRGLGLLSAILVGRMLGKQEYGELGIIQNTIGMFGTLAGFGMGLTANKYVAEFKRTDPARAGRIIALASATAWISSGIMAVVLVACGPWLSAKTLAAPQLGGLLQIGAFLLLFSGVNGAQTGALSGFEAFKRIAHINLISGLLTFPFMVIGAWKWGVTGAVWGLIGSQVANCAMSFLAVRTEAAGYRIPLRYAGCLSDLSLFWSFSLPAVLIGLMNSVAAWGTSALVVNQMGGYGDMGIYNAALRVKQIPDAVLSMLIAPVIPVLSEAFGSADHVSYQKTLRLFLLMSTLTVVPISLVQVAAPELTLLPFGVEYQGRPSIVSCLMFYSILGSLGLCIGYVLTTTNRVWLIWLLSIGFAVGQVLAAVALVPRYAAAGYAASQSLAYLVWLVPGVIVLYRSYPDAMRQARWAGLALKSLSLFALCALGRFLLPFHWAIGLGLVSALAFISLAFRSIHADLSPPKNSGAIS